MVLVLKKDISQKDKHTIEDFLKKKNFTLNEVVGEEETILAAVGKMSMDAHELERLSGVKQVIPISKPYKMASREFKRSDTIVAISNRRGQTIRIGGNRVIAIAGPCAVESREQIMAVAKAVAQSGAVMLRSRAFLRSSPYRFQGLGEEGLRYLREAGDTFGLPVITEIMSPELIDVACAYTDVLQIGSRFMQDFDLLKKVGATKKPVILKRAYTATLEEFLMSAEYLLASGTEDVILCERGIRTFEYGSRNVLDLSSIPVLRELTHLPIIVDPCHALGQRAFVPPMGLSAITAGADGVVLDVHTEPHKALAGGSFSLLPAQFDKLMHDIEALAPVMGKAVAHIREESPSKKVICAYSGKRGAYAEQAISRYFDASAVDALPVDSFSRIFQSVIDGQADFGMVPIENSLAGSVYQNYDNFSRFEDVTIVGAVTLNIRHALLGVKGSTIEDIRTVYSHPQALGQCRKFLEAHNTWNHIEAVSTATAAEFVSSSKAKGNAAIASAVNAALYNLDILQEDIEDDPSNFTRFVVIQSAEKAAAKELNIRPNMASFILKTKNEPGALCRTLGIFESHGINLTRLESRPLGGQPWNYWFYADSDVSTLSGNIYEKVAHVKEELSAVCESVRLLGVYAENRH